MLEGEEKDVLCVVLSVRAWYIHCGNVLPYSSCRVTFSDKPQVSAMTLIQLKN